MHANQEEVVRFSLRAERADSRYMVRQITGMDAEELTPKFYGFGQNTGAKFYDFGMKPRELVIRVILNPTFALNEEHSHIRDELYRAISASRTGEVELRFHSGGSTVAKLTGFIVKLEAGYFNKTPEAQLTIRCEDPMFRGINPVTLGPADIPNANPLVVADSISTAPHGMSFRVEFTNTCPEFEITDPNGEWIWKVVPTNEFVLGDVLIFSSDMANKKICVVRNSDGLTYHLMNAIDTASIWPTIFPGRNEFNFEQLGEFDWLEVSYSPAYWGV